VDEDVCRREGAGEAASAGRARAPGRDAAARLRAVPGVGWALDAEPEQP